MMMLPQQLHSTAAGDGTVVAIKNARRVEHHGINGNGNDGDGDSVGNGDGGSNGNGDGDGDSNGDSHGNGNDGYGVDNNIGCHGWCSLLLSATVTAIVVSLQVGAAVDVDAVVTAGGYCDVSAVASVSGKVGES